MGRKSGHHLLPRSSIELNDQRTADLPTFSPHESSNGLENPLAELVRDDFVETTWRQEHSLARFGAVAAASFPDIVDLVAAAKGWSNWAVDFRYPPRRGRAKPLPQEDELRRALAVIDGLAAQLRAANPEPRGAASG
jgi:hypothetical protein